MKFSILKEILEETLLLSSRFTSTKISSVQAIQGAYIKVDKDIEVTTTNLSDFFHSTITGKIEKPGIVIIDLKKVLEFLTLINPGNIEVSIEEGNLTITQGETRGYFSIYPEGDFPELPIVKGQDYILEKGLLDKIPLVLFSASKDETRPILTGILISAKDGNGSLVSTDGFRLSLLTHEIKEDFPEIVIPASVVGEVVKLSQKGEEVRLVLSKKDKLVRFTIGKDNLYSRVIEGDFPPYEKVVPKSQSTQIYVNRQECIKNIRLVSVFAREQADVIICDVSKDGLYFKPKAARSKKSQVFQEIEKFDGRDVMIAFNYKYVLEFLNTVKSDSVIFELTQATAPGVFKEDGNSDFLHIIMPLRTEETTG